MSLTLDDVQRIALLARIELAPAEAAATLTQLNGIFGLIETMQAVDTRGIEPLTSVREIEARGAAATADMPIGALRLRADVVTEVDRRADHQKPAPAVQDGLYLVPRVIE